MSKAYSNKALPAGTVLREWRLEEVLGVGGFGIVYKAKGIYFGELVAIKEYFPSSISERDAEATVVPIDSDVEEVHALGLKKFVEEAKLLWNLSTPTRHPNIVSVRSLFEIHGTAYMVMDFEDGISLSKTLKKHTRFNERSLWSIVHPIAEGLERAHRVGVLHRDIKPPNILINEDGRPVLIDFGSARFEAAEATSTKVTFHTPPYAALEQYVKTYPQGPWTDIYALGVVLYECVTGEKPPEVLERLHGGLGKPLAQGRYAGYSKRFLAAIDAAMIVKPSDRPQSIPEWLAMFDESKDPPPISLDDSDEEATRFFAHEVAAEEIVPVAPPTPGFTPSEALETGVPADPKKVQFKRAGEETDATRKRKAESAVEAAAAEAAATDDDEEAPATAAPKAATAKPPPPKASAASSDKAPSKKPSPMVVGGAAVALLAAIGGWAIFGRSKSSDDVTGIDAVPDLSAPAPETAGGQDVAGLAAGANTLANDARTAGAPAAAVDALAAASDQLNKQYAALQPLLNDPAQAGVVATRTEEMRRLAMTATATFAGALLSDAEARAGRLASAVPWANPDRASLPRSATAEQQAAAALLKDSLANLRTAAQASTTAVDPASSLAGARNTLASSQAFLGAIPAVYRAQANSRRAAEPLTHEPRATVIVATPGAPVAAAPPVTSTPVTSTPTGAPSSSKLAQLNSVIGDGRGMARQVIAMGSSGSGVRKANAQLARNYDKYLATVKDSSRGAKTDRDVDRLIGQAKQTRAYIQFLLKQSSQAQ